MINPQLLQTLNKHKVIIICVCILLFIACFHKKKELTEFFLNIIVGKNNY